MSVVRAELDRDGVAAFLDERFGIIRARHRLQDGPSVLAHALDAEHGVIDTTFNQRISRGGCVGVDPTCAQREDRTYDAPANIVPMRVGVPNIGASAGCPGRRLL